MVDAFVNADKRITFFTISGAMVYLHAEGWRIGYEDVLSKIATCCAHYQVVGLGQGYVDQFIR